MVIGFVVTYHIDFSIGMSHVAHHTAVLHLVHMLSGDHILVASCRYYNVYRSDHLVQFDNTEAIHTGEKKLVMIGKN
jgi:hypothetical protein